MENVKKATLFLTAALIAVSASGQNPQASAGPDVAEPAVSVTGTQNGYTFKPASSRTQPTGFAHTNIILRSKDGNEPKGVASFDAADEIAAPNSLVQTPETPCSLGHLYVQSPSTVCDPSFNTTGGPSSFGYGAIAIVDAYDNPNAASDLAGFNAHFKLPTSSFTKIYANGNGSCTTVPYNSGWALEESLDIEWAHVFAPKAAIVLVEACSNSYADLVYAEQTAFNYIVANYPEGGQVSNSWGGGESSSQLAYDKYFADFTYNGGKGYSVPILAFASTGDDGAGTEWPSTNPWVVAVGGTSVYRNSGSLAFNSEGCWSGSGGGTSSIETWSTSFDGSHTGPWADFQYPIFGQSARRVPDISADADPSSGAYVLAQSYGGWVVVGGTSLAAPSMAGIVNRSGNKLGSIHINPVTGSGYFANHENNLIYSQLASKQDYVRDFYDVKKGSNGYSALTGYDLCTGVGTPRALKGK